MKIDIIKPPQFENDSYLISIKNIQDFINLDLSKLDEYTKFKLHKFAEEDISLDGWEKFANTRPTMMNLSSKTDLAGSIYTYAAAQRNAPYKYKDIINNVRQLLEQGSRRTSVRIANSFPEYYDSENVNNEDVSCLNLIHYLKDSVKLIFRASDIQHELYTDIITIWKFFIEPIYHTNPTNVEIYACCAQNVQHLEELLELI